MGGQRVRAVLMRERQGDEGERLFELGPRAGLTVVAHALEDFDQTRLKSVLYHHCYFYPSGVIFGE